MIVQNSPSQTVPVASSQSISSPARVAPSRAPVVAAASGPVDQNQVQLQAGPEALIELVGAALDAVNKSLASAGSSLQFSIDRETNNSVVTMVDGDTGEVIRQIPSEEALAIARSIDQMLQRTGSSSNSGILCKQTA